MQRDVCEVTLKFGLFQAQVVFIHIHAKGFLVLQLFQIKALQIAPIMVKKSCLKKKPGGLEKPKAKAKPKAKSFTQALRSKALEKAKAQSFEKDPKATRSSSSKALGKAKAKSLGKGSKATTNSSMNVLKKAKLNKMKMATEEVEDAEEAAALLKKKMTKLDTSKVWSRHQTALKAGPEKEKESNTSVPWSKFVWETSSPGTREDKWDSEPDPAEIYQAWAGPPHPVRQGAVEGMPYHMGSFWVQGYSKLVHTANTSRKKEWTSGKECEPEEEGLEKFMELFNNEHHALEVDDHCLGKGNGPGKGKRSGKGKGKGKGKGGQGALGEDEEDEEDEEKFMKAVRTARNMVSSSKADLEEALEKAKARLSKSGRNAAALRANELEKALQWLKSTLAGKVKGLEPKDIKAKLKRIAAKIKDARAEKNELKGLAQKAFVKCWQQS